MIIRATFFDAITNFQTWRNYSIVSIEQRKKWSGIIFWNDSRGLDHRKAILVGGHWWTHARRFHRMVRGPCSVPNFLRRCNHIWSILWKSFGRKTKGCGHLHLDCQLNMIAENDSMHILNRMIFTVFNPVKCTLGWILFPSTDTSIDQRCQSERTDLSESSFSLLLIFI